MPPLGNSEVTGCDNGGGISGGGSPRSRRSVTRRSESICRADEASEILSRRFSRVSIPSRARRMSDCSSWRDRANRRRFSDNADKGTSFGCDEGAGIISKGMSFKFDLDIVSVLGIGIGEGGVSSFLTSFFATVSRSDCFRLPGHIFHHFVPEV